MKKFAFKGKNRIFSIIALSALLLICIAVPVYAALFSSSVKIGGSAAIGSLTSTVQEGSISTLSTSYTSGTLSFTNPGQKKVINVTLNNNSSAYLHYYYGITVEAGTDGTSGLENVIMVYYDDKFTGMLSSLCSAGEGIIDNDEYVFPTGKAHSSSVHTLTFELHIAATDSYYAGKECNIKIESYASTVNYQKVMFAGTEDELRLAINDVNFGLADQKIVLTNNITLTENYVLSNACEFDLFGYELNFNNNKITVDLNGEVNLKSSAAPSYSVLTAAGGFELNNSKAYLLIDDFYYTPENGDKVNVGKLYGNNTSVILYDTEKAAEGVWENLNDNTGDGIPSGSSVDLFGANYFYASSLGITTAGDGNYSYVNGIITVSETSITKVTNIIINGEKKELKIIGGSDAQTYANILLTELNHIPQTSGDEVQDISYDLFLPASLKEKNTSIEWTTDNSAVMTADGKIAEEMTGDSTVRLTAFIKINSSVFTKVFVFRVFKQNNQTKLTNFLAQVNPVTLKYIYSDIGSEIYLPSTVGSSASDIYFYTNAYQIKDSGGNIIYDWGGYSDIGIETLSYSVSNTYNYVTLSTAHSGYPEVYLNTAVFYTYAQIDVSATFKNDSENVYTGSVNVIIELGDNGSLQELVYGYVGGILSDVDVLQNIIDTRKAYGQALEKGDFILPGNYKSYTVSYSVADTSGIISAITLNTDGTYTVSINAEKFNAQETDVPIKVIMEIQGLTDPEKKPTRDLSIRVPAAVHNDSEGFYNSSVFDSVKYQVWQQMAESEKTDSYNTNSHTSGYYLSGGNLSVDFNINGASSYTADNNKVLCNYNYILLRDIVGCTTLAFTNDSDNKFMQLLGWASSSNATNTAADVLGISATGDYANKANGKTFITVEEKAAITAYAESLNSSVTDTTFNIEWAKDTVTYNGSSDGYYIISYVDDFNSAINTLINTTYSGNFDQSNSATYFKFSELMQWATTTENTFPEHDGSYNGIKTGNAPDYAYMDSPYYTYYNDKLSTISQNEFDVIKNFWSNIGNSSYESAISTAFNTIWEKYVVHPTYFTATGRADLYKFVTGTSVKGGTASEIGSLSVDGFTYGDNSTLNYLKVVNLDSSVYGLRYFTALTRLSIVGADNTLTPIISSSANAKKLINTVTGYNTELLALELKNCFYSDIGEFDISNVINLENLKYLDISGNTAVETISSLTEISENLCYLNVTGIGQTFADIKSALDYIYYYSIDSAGSATLINCDGYTGINYYSPSVAETYKNELYALYNLTDIILFESEHQQLTEKLYSGSNHCDVEWRVEKGNPITTLNKILPYDSEVNSSSAMMGFIINYFYYNNYLYTFTSSGTGISSTEISIYSSVSSIGSSSINRHTARYYFYTGNESGFTANSIIHGTRNNMTTYVTYAKKITSSNEAVTIASNTSTYKYTGTTTTLSYHKANYSTANASQTFTNGMVYTVTFSNGALSYTESSADGICVSKVLNSASNLTYGNYYYYTGVTASYNGKAYTNNNVYRLLYNLTGGYYLTQETANADSYGNVMDKATFCTDESAIASLLNILPVATNSDIGKLYRLTDTSTNYQYTYRYGAIYELCQNFDTGTYYFKTFGAMSIESYVSGGKTIIRINNDRNYFGTDGYAGTSGREAAMFTATVNINGVSVTKKFNITVVGHSATNR